MQNVWLLEENLLFNKTLLDEKGLVTIVFRTIVGI